MTTIYSLGKSISQMSDEEALFIVRGTRKRRYIIPERRKGIVAAKRVSNAKASKRTVDLFAAMSSEERAKLIKLLEDQA